MRAATLRGTGDAFVTEDLRLRDIGPRDVHVRVVASGVCHSDLSIQDGTIPHPLPAVLGHEGAGVVLETGADVTTVSAGDHVVLAWVAPCRACFFCLRGHPELCEHGLDHAFAQPYATAPDGTAFLAAFGTATFGEETIVPERACVKIDPAFPLELGALVGCGVVTGVGSVCNSARVEPGASVVVIGCGGVGLAAIQGARLAGAAPIIAVDRVATKLELARRCGATDVIDATQTDQVAAVRELTSGRGADFVFEVVGRSATIEAAFEMTRRAGTCTIVGAGSPTDMVRFGALQLMVGAKSLRGCVYGSTDPARDFPEIVRLQQAGKLDLDALVTRRIALDELNDAFRAMQAGEVARSIITY
ncbi:MAG: S-(hydroxymethyl)glutathione dehydrogenase / alcohol dehydrogenase [Actinomycetota bacterium]|nr:S-(hydroxymethyl)glutathione dehydrogenase / alcohol dehydrogenase [Actinomycetota bacterium]